MERIALKMNCVLAFLLAGMLTVGPAIAEKPAWAGGGKGGEKSERREQPESNKGRQRDGDERSSRDRNGSTVKLREHFSDRHRTVSQITTASSFAPAAVLRDWPRNTTAACRPARPGSGLSAARCRRT